ncbi:unnamed protein product [Hymenolepis diminuta]|uniref:Uncharacterized protein n=1 Tax=Hymenolepis diminuta TaxID=6216 RepID=A0A564YYJ2_HYMDI|nr:unnamed protein product [Hymenolepis diminuta]
MFSYGLTQVTHKFVFLFPLKIAHTCQLPVHTLPVHLLCFSASPSLSLLLASTLVVAYLNTSWSSQPLVFCSSIDVSSYLNSYKSVTVVVIVVRC